MTQQTTTPQLDNPAERMTRKQAAEYLGVSKSFLAQDAMTGRHGVPFYKLGARMVWYVRGELETWMAGHKVAHKEAA